MGLLTWYCLQLRLVHLFASFTLTPEGFHFLLRGKTFDVYTESTHQGVRFYIDIPDFEKDRISKRALGAVEDTVNSLNLTQLTGPEPRKANAEHVFLLEKGHAQILNEFRALKVKIAELRAFRRGDFYDGRRLEGNCDKNIGKVVQTKEIIALNTSVTAIAAFVPKSVTWQEIVEPAHPSFLQILRVLEDVKKLLRESLTEIETLVHALEYLKKGEISGPLLNVIKEETCFSIQPSRLDVQDVNCHFNGEGVDCYVIFTQLGKSLKLRGIHPIGYLGHAIDVSEYYLDEKKRELVRLNCSNISPAKHCAVLSTDSDPCAQSLRNAAVAEIIATCNFHARTLPTHFFTEDGIFLNDPAINAYLESNVDGVRKRDYFHLQMPALIMNNVTLVLEAQQGRYRYMPMFKSSNIIKSIIKEENLRQLLLKIGKGLEINEGILYALSHGSLGVVSLTLAALLAALGYKLWKLRKRFADGQRRTMSPKITKFVRQ